MPESNFSQLMAQMIAQARPPQAPPSRGHTVLPGGRGGLIDTTTQTSFGIDLGPWARLFGYLSPEEKRRLGEQFVAARANYPDEVWEDIINQSKTQKILGSALKAGVVGIIEEGPGPYGRKRYNVAKPAEEALVRGLTPEQIIARGGETAKRLKEFEMEKIKAQRPLEDRMYTAPPEEFAEYVTRRSELEKRLADARLTEQERAVLGQQLKTLERAEELHKLDMQIRQEQLSHLPTQRQMEMEKHLSDLKTAEALRRYHEAHAESIASPGEKEEVKEIRDMKKDLNTSFNIFLKEWNKVKSSAIGATFVDRDKLIESLYLETEKYIAGLSGISRDLTRGNYPVGFWLSHVEQEINQMLTPEGKLPIIGRGIFGGVKVDTQQDLRWQRYLRQISTLTELMIEHMTEHNLLKSIKLFNTIFENVTKTPSSIETAKSFLDILAIRGRTSSTLQNLIREAISPTPKKGIKKPEGPIEIGGS